MSPWETVGGKRKWKAPTAEARAKRGLSVLPEHATPSQKVEQTQAQVTGGGMSPGFQAKYQQALTQQQTGQIPGQPQPIEQPQDLGWWEKTKQAWRSGVEGITPATIEELQEPWETGMARLTTNIQETGTMLQKAGKIAIYGSAIGLTIGTLLGTLGIGGTAGAGVVATNTKTVAASTGMLTALGIGAGTAGMIVTLLGTYPFSNFVGKEEAAQTLDFGFRAAMDANDLDMADEVLDKKAEILGVLENAEEFIEGAKRPEGMSLEDWEKLPIANLMVALKDYVESAQITLKAQRLLVENMRNGTDKWTLEHAEEEARAARIAEENARIIQESQEAIIELQKIAHEAKLEREKAFALEQIEMWRAHQIEMEKIAEENAERNRQFWLEYLKLKMKAQEEGGRSTLGFGLL